MRYEFSKELKAYHQETLYEELKFRSELSEFIEGISVSNANEKKLTIITNKDFSLEEIERLKLLIDSISDSHELVIRKKLQVEVVSDAMSSGMQFLEAFSANNVYRQKTAEQINNLLNDYPMLITCCATGSLVTLRQLLDTMQPDENISQEEIEEFTKRLDFMLT